ncbi:MAG: ABC transporter permease [Clostridiales Family XIII bacterium]|nr:ABC transporter permease [Clostridiales Family XIII bacterium]
MLRVSKRAELPQGRVALIRTAAVLLSLAAAAAALAAFGLNPLDIYGAIVEGAFGTGMRARQTVIKAVPLIITSLGILVAFKMKFWNIGGEGQIMAGAFAAAYVALYHGDLPRPLLLPLMALAGMAMGGVWALIPGLFKAKLGTNETIFTLMMNYIAIKFVEYLQFGPWKDPEAGGFPKIAIFPENAVLPNILGVHAGWVVALAAVAAVHLFMNHTKKGFEISVVGESAETARYAGMNITGVIVAAMLASGGLCGLTGMIQASAIDKTLGVGLSANYGFTAIITAWLARLNAVALLFVCVAFAVLLQGSAYIQLAMKVPAAVAGVVQGIILFFVLGSEFFLQYKVSRKGRV